MGKNMLIRRIEKLRGIESLESRWLLADDFGSSIHSAHPVDIPGQTLGTIEEVSDEDWFSFSAVSGVTYLISTNSFDTNLRLLDSGGHEVIRGRPNEVSFTANADRMLFVELSILSPHVRVPLNYQLEVQRYSDVDDHGNDAENATLIAASSTTSGRVEVPHDSDWFSFSANARTSYLIDMDRDTSGVSQLLVYDAQGLVASSNGEGPSAVVDFTIDTDVFIEVSHERSTSYEIVVEELVDEHGNQPATATDIPLPFNTHSDLGAKTDADWFSFSAVSGETYLIELKAIHTVLELYDSDGLTQIDSVSLLPFINWTANADRNVFVRVSNSPVIATAGTDLSTPRSYELGIQILSNVDDHGNDARNATPIGLPSATPGELESPHEKDWFAFSVVAGSTYLLEVEGADELRLFDEDGTTELRMATPGFVSHIPFTNPQIVWEPSVSADLFLEVTDSFRKSYELIVRELNDDHGNQATTATNIVVPSNTAGNLEVDVELDWFSFAARSGVTYLIEVETEPAAALKLIDSDGRTVLREYAGSRPPYLAWTADDDRIVYVEVSKFPSFVVPPIAYALVIQELPDVDDHGNDADHATTIEVPSNTPGRLEATQEFEADWFVFSAVADETYTIQLEGANRLRLYDADGTTELAASDLTVPRIVFQARTSGDLYIEISDRTLRRPYDLFLWESIDVNRDGSVDCLDINHIMDDISTGTRNLNSELTGDLVVNLDDRDVWLTKAGAALLSSGAAIPMGDADLDGVVDSRDLNIVGTKWQQTATGWCHGDFNADGHVDEVDLNAIGVNWLRDVATKDADGFRRAPRAPLADRVDIAMARNTYASRKVVADAVDLRFEDAASESNSHVQELPRQQRRYQFITRRQSSATSTDLGIVEYLSQDLDANATESWLIIDSE